ncbi:hypothetical protein NUU61_008421 [Penicillium alfredii]|uniref:Zn(2)-C6 fungal-type domain-containing protein n=1 Tax=Penicillium alfredii TaxID=1506179 RepID=A0A9W9ESM5_9EURO|nr:uncharacterized protein NUU61_008421 [Penicillium alfredii]KAJ5087114.1 hypothetical protein NUU61_008421 [Penicillium alfredii]
MPMVTGALAKAPCLSCRGDKRKPVCKRCEGKGLKCIPALRKTVFRHGSTANFDAQFAGDQPWVNSEPKNWKSMKDFLDTPSAVSTRSVEESIVTTGIVSASSGNGSSGYSPLRHFHSNHDHDLNAKPSEVDENHKRCRLNEPISIGGFLAESGTVQVEGMFEPMPTHPDGQRSGSEDRGLTLDRNTDVPTSFNTLGSSDCLWESATSDQEACLLRYFIEELSPWFDHCDEQKHFQLVVPRRAQSCPVLRHAVLAVSSRHLSRLPQYNTPRGIIYRGQLLPDLQKSTAVEYMLRCIPDLENIIAATVILRQYEELEEEMEECEIVLDSPSRGRVNFLVITQKIIDAIFSAPLNRSLATASYWIAIRQEVYYALTRERAPTLRIDDACWHQASVANTLIVFAGQVAQWHWGQRLSEEWTRLRSQQQQLECKYIEELKPLLYQKADRSKGHIFPTVWYFFDSQVTGVQHLELAKMILIAASPHLRNGTRAAHRKAEALVRSSVLKLCGISLNRPQCQPALINAVIAITLYGDFSVNRKSETH